MTRTPSTGSSPLPERGRAPAQILDDLRGFGARDPDYRQARLFSLVYWLDEEYEQLLHQAWGLYSSANGLSPSAFKSLKQMENDIVAVAAQLQHGDGATCGVLTSGGTESCLLAAKTWRDVARSQRGVTRPNMVLPRTAHVAWHKAAEYFDVAPRWLALDADGLADAGQLDALIDDQTTMVLGSAPNYPNGGIDPIGAMGEIAAARGVPVHVDACVGGFVLPFMAMNGRALPEWDYRVPGVMSISADLHKYGYAAKGASVITYRRIEDMKHQMFATVNWPGGVFASPALLGTRNGGAYAAAWAALQHHGREGYCELARRATAAFDRLREGIAAMPELRVVGRPSGPLIAYTARESEPGSGQPALPIFAVADRLDALGWRPNRVQQPDALHGMVTAAHLEVVDRFLADLRSAVDQVRADPALGAQGSAATYAGLAQLPPGAGRQKVIDGFSRGYVRQAAR